MKKAFRNDARAKVTGQAIYTDDLKLHDMLHAVPIYSELSRAKLISLDTSAALKLPGVIAVITAKDIPGNIYYGQIIKDYPVLVDKDINSTGDVLALVVAKTREQAIAAVPSIKIELQPLKPILDPEEAMNPEADILHPSHVSNLTNYHRVRRGDVTSAEKEADIIIEEEFSTSRVEHSYLEPESAICHLRCDGVMEVFGSMQHPFSTRRFVASTLGVELKDVEVKLLTSGGGFGGKDDTAALVCARAALCAWILKKPVKITYTREWSMRESYKRHPYKMRYRMGLNKEGKILSVKARIVADGGAYCSVTPWVTWRSTVQSCGCYEVPNVETDVYGVYTNNIFSGAMRGFGSPQINFAVEQLVEIAAEKLGIDEITFRQINMVKQGSTTITGQVLENHLVSLNQVLDTVLKESDYKNKRQLCSFGNPNHQEWYGIGLAICYRGVSLGAEGTDVNSAILYVQPDGSVLLETGVFENGQGSESAMILIAAEQLGLPLERIRYRMPSTSNIPDGGSTVASRGTIMGGGAVVKAANILKQIVGEAVQKYTGKTVSNFENSQLLDPSGVLIMSWDEAIKLCYNNQIYPYAFGVFQPPQISWDEETGQGNAYYTWVYGCQAAELKVDPKTGIVKLLNMIAAHDIGKAVNPFALKGQYYGGMAMGAGYALFENCPCENGLVVPTNFNKYRLPRSIDLPEMKAIFIENPDPVSPSGAKGIGEPANELMAPAIANAIYYATGKRYHSLPIRIKI